MRKRLVKFCHRGLKISGFGPIVYGIVMYVLYLCNVDTISNGVMIFKGIVSTYIVGFIASGIGIIYDEERLGIGFSSLIHGFVLYFCYLFMYLFNGWIIKENILWFSLIFFLVYFVIWIGAFMVEMIRAKRFNSLIKK